MYLMLKVELNEIVSLPHITFHVLSAQSSSPHISCSDPARPTTNPESRHQKISKNPLLTTPEKFKSSLAAHTR